ncbi:MAG: hypothetical protein H6867_06395 [Rhodospirillales bacterium]|nr:hypothetical protein [Rhodospirillales bacterium]MCB9995178.1 hypothetical protein [Rhodospirillales bacterium]
MDLRKIFDDRVKAETRPIDPGFEASIWSVRAAIDLINQGDDFKATLVFAEEQLGVGINVEDRATPFSRYVTLPPGEINHGYDKATGPEEMIAQDIAHKIIEKFAVARAQWEREAQYMQSRFDPPKSVR